MQSIWKSMKAFLAKLHTYTVQSLRKQGVIRTCMMWFKVLISHFRLFLYEPVRKLVPLQPSQLFDSDGGCSRIVVHIHMYYIELLDEMITYTNHIPYKFDCYISTDSKEKAEMIRQRFTRDSRAKRTEVQCFQNIGRDVAPLILQMSPVIGDYDYMLHLHTKYSMHNGFGNRWRSHLLNSLLESNGYVAAIISQMEEEKRIGIIFQRTYWRVKPSLGWKGNKAAGKALLARIGLADIRLREPQFPAGNMFWVKTDAVIPLFRCGLTLNDFDVETQRVDGTLAHSVERCWGYIVASQGYDFLRVWPSHR